MENVPSDIDFIGKQPRAKDEFEKRNERSLEALACSILHPCVIKF
jgi:serine/threonine protein kinase